MVDAASTGLTPRLGGMVFNATAATYGRFWQNTTIPPVLDLNNPTKNSDTNPMRLDTSDTADTIPLQQPFGSFRDDGTSGGDGCTWSDSDDDEQESSLRMSMLNSDDCRPYAGLTPGREGGEGLDENEVRHCLRVDYVSTLLFVVL
jgi:hypothetical protein